MGPGSERSGLPPFGVRRCGRSSGIRTPAGTVNLIGYRRVDTYDSSWAHGSLCHSGNAGDLGLCLKRLGPGGSILGGGKVIAAEVEEVVDPVVGREKTLCLPGRLEPLHLPFSSACRLVRILGPVVQSFMLPVLDTGHDLPLCRAITGELIHDHDTRWPHLLFQQLPKEPLGSVFVASALD